MCACCRSKNVRGSYVFRCFIFVFIKAIEIFSLYTGKVLYWSFFFVAGKFYICSVCCVYVVDLWMNSLLCISMFYGYFCEYSWNILVESWSPVPIGFVGKFIFCRFWCAYFFSSTNMGTLSYAFRQYMFVFVKMIEISW